jgi:PAS domain S-box-containing protein
VSPAVAPAPNPDGPWPSRGEARREAVRRLSAVALVTFAFAVALAVHLFDTPGAAPRWMLLPVTLAVMTAAGVLTFPWGRVPPGMFFLVGLPANALVAWAAALTGAGSSPVLSGLCVVAALAGAYGGGVLLGLQVVVGATMPLLAHALAPGDGPWPFGTALVLLPALAASAAAARVAARAGGAGRPARSAATALVLGVGSDEAPRLIDDAVLSSLNLDGVLDQLLAGAASRLGADRVALVLADGTVHEFQPDLAVSATQDLRRRLLAIPPPPFEVPVSIGGERLGLLCIVPAGRATLDERQQTIARDLAVQAAVAIERARLFDRVFRATQELETLFQVLRQGIAIADRDGRLVRANRAFGQLLGIPAAAVLGRPAAELLPGGAPALSHVDVIDPDERLTREVEDQARGRWFEVTSTPLFDPEHLLIGLVHVVRDVTDERRMKAHLVQSEKLAALGQLVAGVSHELNSPLGIILGHAELLAGSPRLDAESRDSAEAIVGQATRATGIVRQLLSFGRRHAPVKQPVSVNDLLRGLARLVEVDFRVNRQRPIRLVLDLDPRLPEILADPHQLEQVCLNILTNARQAIVAAGRGEEIELSTRNLGRTVRIRIADDGPGIPAAVLSRIFDPFFTTKPDGEGTGLGLSICYGLIEEHGGRIWAESVKGRGAAFYVELPVDADRPPC